MPFERMCPAAPRQANARAQAAGHQSCRGAEATTRAKLKNARLKKLKERSELYLLNRWNEIGVEDDGGVDSEE